MTASAEETIAGVSVDLDWAKDTKHKRVFEAEDETSLIPSVYVSKRRIDALGYEPGDSVRVTLEIVKSS